jgi:hypothetical protein
LGIGTKSPADSIDIQQTDSVIRFKNTGASNFEGIELYNPTTGNLVAGYGSYGNTENGYIQDSTGNAVIFNSTVWGFAGRVVRMGDAHGGKYGFHHQYNTYRTGFGGILGSAAKATIHISGSGNNIGLYSEGFISGSSTSTGSFGAIFNPGIHSNPTKLTFAGSDAQFESGFNSSKISTNGNQMTFYNTSANAVGYIYAATTLLQIGAYSGNRGTIQFTADNGSTLFAEMTGSYTISGSATGTGSFGNIRVGDKTASENRFMSFAGDEGFKIGYAQSGFLAHDGQGSEGVDAEISMTGTGGSAPFDNHGSIVYKTRAVSTLARSSHIFYTGRASAERLRIDHVGNVGIGTASPGQKLTVEGHISTGDSNGYYFLNPGQYDGSHTAGLGWNKLQLGNNGFNYIVAGHRVGTDSNAYLDFYTDNQSHPTGSIDGKHVMRMNHDGNIFVYSGSLILEGNSSGNVSGSASSVGSFGTLKSFPKNQSGVVNTISEVYSSYQKRSNHARYEPMILKNIFSGTGFVPVELVQTTGSGEYHVTHGEMEVYIDQTNNPLRFHFHSHWNQTYWYRTSISVISKDSDHRNVPIYFANKDGKGYMLIGDDKFNRWSTGYVFMKYAVKTNYDDGFDQLLDIDIGSIATNFSDYNIEKTHDENYYSNLGKVKSTSTNYDGYHTIGKFLGSQDSGYARVRITRGLVAIAEFEVGGAYQRWNGRLLSTRGYSSFNNFFTSFRVQDSGSVSYLQVSTVGQNSSNAEATLIASDGNFKLLPWEATGSAGGGSTVLEVPLSRHEPFTIVNQDLTLQGGTYADGNVSGSSTSTGSFGEVVDYET